MGIFRGSLDLLMRLPGLIMVDFWWQFEEHRSTLNEIEVEPYYQTIQVNVALFYGLATLLLPRICLIRFYKGALFVLALILSHVIAEKYRAKELKICQEEGSQCEFSLQSKTSHALFFVVLLLLILVLNFITENICWLFLLAGHHLVVVARVVGLPISMLESIEVIADLSQVLAAIYFACVRHTTLTKCAGEGFRYIFIHCGALDIPKFTILIWKKFMVPRNFLVFWILNMIAQGVEMYTMEYEHSFRDKPFHYILHCASGVCRTPMTLISTAVIIYYVSMLSIKLVILFLEADDDDDPMHSGWTQGLMMFILGLQTGIMDIPLEDRASTLLVILFVVASSLLQCIMEITEPVILSLSATRRVQKSRHRRALLVCAALFVLPLVLTANLATFFSVDFWILIVLSTCILTSIRVLGTLVVHGLFVYDGMFDRGPDLDEVVYYARSLTKILEFLVAIFVVVAGIHENSTGKWSIANTSILVVHSYCNVYRRMQEGWRSFLLRREASINTEALATPTDEELEKHCDVCPICYQWLTPGERSMCITPCNHYFHRACLKKWLYSEDKCPMCHQQIIGSDLGRGIDVDTAMHVIQALEQETQ